MQESPHNMRPCCCFFVLTELEQSVVLFYNKLLCTCRQKKQIYSHLMTTTHGGADFRTFVCKKNTRKWPLEYSVLLQLPLLLLLLLFANDVCACESSEAEETTAVRPLQTLATAATRYDEVCFLLRSALSYFSPSSSSATQRQ